MHMILRTILIFFKRGLLRPAHIGDPTLISMRVLPTDLDLLWHVNNGVYFSFMDFGRWDMVFRTGLYKLSTQNKIYAVVAGENIKFKKSLKLWDKFQIETQNIGFDDKYFFVRQKFLLKNEVMAIGLVKIRFLKKGGGTISPHEIMEKLGDHNLSMNTKLGEDWFNMDRQYLI